MKRVAPSRAQRQLVAARDGHACQYCLLRQRGQASRFHVDHIVPIARGGPTVLENFSYQCPACSGHKAAKVDGFDPIDGERVALFHPLRQRWGDHFALEADGTVVGLTPTGRATVDALEMNDALPREARADQISTGTLEPTR